MLDTHIVIRWFYEPRRLTRGQKRIIETAERQGTQLGVSAFTLIEIALLVILGRISRSEAKFLWSELDSNALLKIIPLSTEIADEIAVLAGSLRDPADQTIVATARVHRLQLLTADQRIIDSELVSVIE